MTIILGTLFCIIFVCVICSKVSESWREFRYNHPNRKGWIRGQYYTHLSEKEWLKSSSHDPHRGWPGGRDD